MKKVIILVIDTPENESSVIGQYYKPRDNSWDKNCETGQWEDLIGRTFIVSSKPYKKQVHEGWELRRMGPSYYDMIKAIDINTGVEYEMLYNPRCLVQHPIVKLELLR